MMLLRPNVAGSFYPHDPKDLRLLLKSFEKRIRHKEIEHLKEDVGVVRAVIAPHAGYVFSGLVAMYVYYFLYEINKDVSGFLLWGPSHYYSFYGAVQPDSFDKWQTPFGYVDIHRYDEEIMKLDAPFLKEHSLEVHLPFMQYFFDNFYVKPLLFGSSFCLNTLSPKEDEVLVVSSDLSHYLPYEEARKRDEITLKYIIEKDVNSFDFEGDACGKYAISCLLKIAKIKGWKAKLIKYMNSGDILHDKSQVVGYGGVVFYE